MGTVLRAANLYEVSSLCASDANKHFILVGIPDNTDPATPLIKEAYLCRLPAI